MNWLFFSWPHDAKNAVEEGYYPFRVGSKLKEEIAPSLQVEEE